jgi:hypothetical protein
MVKAIMGHTDRRVQNDLDNGDCMDSDLIDLFVKLVITGICIAIAAALLTGVMIGGCIANV